MATLAAQLDNLADGVKQNAPAPIAATIGESIANLKKTFDHSAVIKPGTPLPSFKLPNALGKDITSEELLAKGPILITFYRGDWCPFCNLALRSLQQHLDQFKAKGVTVVAISPELPNTSLTTTEKNELKFEVLSDVGNKFARQLGICWEQPESVKPVFEAFSIDLKGRNGDESFALPVPTTLLVDSKGVVRNIHTDPDYMKRLEPTTALEWIDAL
ncbi:AhpC-TSA-domain-containing protein [Trichoderma citrinoviride]|uniref:thioredoxin-dependent peroxiredoxin n=1 Tax=Trichoderma citrinoviride TaxID=58853 RepID=A0A2T4AYZ1_9HYPO|nr:AhpC-TSA-domain-containing protein [Trichoderma citrinoviride]PTB62290.1 AhpC-TSA-domain-containing protein [Trichoderma citrinoviride]